jgi:dolichol-phosphate mannosyltransferase
MKKKVSIVIACYRDGQAIPVMHERLVQALEPLGIDFEIIFVNDASPDDAEEVLRGLAARDPRVIAINHSRNFGSQAAFTSGMHLATGDAVVLMDGDLQDPPEIIPKLVEKWREGHDVVYGERVKREATWFLQIAYKAFYRVFRALSYVRIPTDAGDFSLIDRKVVDAINAMPERDRFVRGLRAWAGFRQVGVPYVRPERMFGVTTNNLIKNIAWARKGIFSFSFAPLEWISYLAGSVTVISVCAIVFYLVAYAINPSRSPTGFMTLLMVSLFLGSVQLLCLSIIGEYVGRVFEEVKQRPHYIVKSIFNPPRRDGEPPTSP